MGCRNTVEDIENNKHQTFECDNENAVNREANAILSNPHLSSTSLHAKCIFPSNIQSFPRLSQIEHELLSISLLMEINKARMAPKEYINTVKKYMSKIHPATPTKNSYISVSSTSAIALKKGVEAFDDCIHFLEKQRPLQPLQMDNALNIDFPDIINDCVNMTYIEKAIKNKYEKLKDMYNGNIQLKKFHFDINTPSAEISCVMQIVDDTQSNLIRRNNIFNEKINIVSINCELVSKGIVCFYLAFGIKQ